MVKATGLGEFKRVAVSGAGLVVQDGVVRASDGVEAEHDATVTGLVVGNLSFDVDVGEVNAICESGRVRVRHARRCDVTRFREDPALIVAGPVEETNLDDIAVEVGESGRIERCAGCIRLRRCWGTIMGDGEHLLTVDFDVGGEVADSDALRGAVLMDVRIGADSLAAIIAASEEVRVLDPIPASIGWSLEHVRTGERSGIAELLHDRLSEKAKRPNTVDAAAVAVLETRRNAAKRPGVDWLLLHTYGALGYGRKVGRPLGLWLGIVVVLCAARLGAAFEDSRGVISWHNGPVVASVPRALSDGGDVVLSVALLPFTWGGTSTADLSKRVGVIGGYLIAARILLLLPLLTAGAAVRRRIRVRPSNEAK
jgi:hypothetical protein